MDKHDERADFSASEIENTLCRKFYKTLMRRFTKAIVEYELVEPFDKIAVCVSGGKSSMLMAKLFQQLKRHNKFEFGLVFLFAAQSDERAEEVNRIADALDIPLTTFRTSSVTLEQKEPSQVEKCLLAKARELGCNKIALGHNYDDVIVTILTEMLLCGRIRSIVPRRRAAQDEATEIIRPMYLIRNADILKWQEDNRLAFVEAEEIDERRAFVGRFISDLASADPEIEQNIFKSVENVNLATVIAYVDRNGVRHYFADET